MPACRPDARARARRQECPNPWDPKSPYFIYDGCFYEVGSGSSFLDAPALACQAPWAATESAPLDNEGHPAQPCACPPAFNTLP